MKISDILQTIMHAILTACLCVEMSTGQITYLTNGYAFPSVASASNSGIPSSSFSRDSISAAPLNKEQNLQFQNTPSVSFRESPLYVLNSESTFPTSAFVTNPSPIENFIASFNTTVYNSQTLPDIFDLKDLSAEAFSKSLYDYVYAVNAKLGHSNPHYIASTVAMPLKEGIEAFTLPVVLDIYANTIAKYLFAKGALNPSNASTLALKFAKTMEDTAKRSWAKENPETKFLVLEDGFRDYMSDLHYYSANNQEDLAFHFDREVKRVASQH